MRCAARSSSSPNHLGLCALQRVGAGGDPVAAVQEALVTKTVVFGGEVREPTTWTIFQQDGPYHLGLWQIAIP